MRNHGILMKGVMLILSRNKSKIILLMPGKPFIHAFPFHPCLLLALFSKILLYMCRGHDPSGAHYWYTLCGPTRSSLEDLPYGGCKTYRSSVPGKLNKDKKID